MFCRLDFALKMILSTQEQVLLPCQHGNWNHCLANPGTVVIAFTNPGNGFYCLANEGTVIALPTRVLLPCQPRELVLLPCQPGNCCYCLANPGTVVIALPTWELLLLPR